MMRQAGRYLPDYIKLREKYSFFERCETPELVSQITTMPVWQVGVDAAILFSDILVVPKAMGLEVQLIEHKGPVLPDPVRTAKDLDRIHVIDGEQELHYVMQGIKATRSDLDNEVPLIGFAGAPWTLLCYMVEGKGSKSFDRVKEFCYTQNILAHQLLDMLTESTISYLKAQRKFGVDVVQVFDSWAGLLSPKDFREFALPYLTRIVNAISPYCPVIVFAKGSWYALEELSNTNASALGVDWCIEPEMARTLAGSSITLQGNFDPAKLLMPISQIKKEVKQMIHAFGTQRYIANLGHGILPHVPVDHAKAFVDAVKQYRPEPLQS
jgi:uroporphyrinogen decarboxylase